MYLKIRFLAPLTRQKDLGIACPIHLIQDTFDQLEGLAAFSMLDLKSRFHEKFCSIQTIERRPLFVCHRGLSSWCI